MSISRTDDFRLAKLPLTLGHTRTLSLLEGTDAFKRTRQLYAAALVHDVYLRPAAAGFTVLSLAPEVSALVGVGGLGGDSTITQLLPSSSRISMQVDAYRTKVAAMVRASAEERLSAAWVRHALANGLLLPSHHGLPATPLHLLAQEWRFMLEGGGSAKLDVLAINAATRRLVVIELKSRAGSAGRGGTPEQQAGRYASWLHEGRAYFTPFFAAMARAMAGAYDGPPEMRTMQLDDSRCPEHLVVTAE